MESTISTIRQMNYKKQIVTSAVYDILDKNSAVYHRDKNSVEQLLENELLMMQPKPE